MGEFPTVTDVARVAGVSRQTVSNVMNTPGIVKADTRARVEAAISALGYRPHASARRLRTRRSSTIGIRLDPMIDGISGSVLDRFLHALTEQADARGLRVLLFTATSPEDEISQFRRLNDGADVDGFVLTSTTADDPRTEWLLEQGIAFVTFGRPWRSDDFTAPRHPWVDVDGYSGLHAATRAQQDAGATRIAYIGWPSPSGTGDDRRRGWHDAMLERGDVSAEDLARLEVVTADGVDQGAAAMQQLARTAGGIDAVLCASDALALGAMIANPARVPVTGYDNTPIAAAIGLSSVDQPVDEVAAAALELLAGEFEGKSGAPSDPAPPPFRMVTPRLITRQFAAIPRDSVPVNALVSEVSR
ncbi:MULTISPECIES: LacI family DNA-binding transcriptional regulator [unclassified Cryobacterium]|uniref:LacI family DNA-binding transcriptional regulator n=2 Tax=Cryobacterium TaxID=69578 RepID=UPI00106A1AEF|nr:MULTISPECIES: LacI family DNA-binding transcriptional regulator [unclassified Cryobacterium]MDY7528732.1 LacI family DNA-binding transcriptional regulator [Cryobacterium sp. 10C2]MDY7555523.1 LacI family DNA-binding transcriptional regulator [Cryobacterium sp. 10C3]MEB0201715.1 LacI family DNA-binding transcriptional regulator [Cryobacterium sp. 5I3]MEB0287920.1 LacI family DNA-binding transcriptional regulator [Cryobacterium sp. 10S3]MEB0289822.1 LacI family DNA-binding transcriptional reg